MIGKTLLDKSGITKFFGGEINVKDIKPLPIYVDDTSWENFKSEIDRLEKDPVQVDLYLKTHGLDKVEGLRDYILNNDIKQSSVNNLIQTQNYKNIADQAHGFLGVKKAIDEYNKSLIVNEDNTTTASDGTKELNKTISQSNSSLGKYLTKLDGATAGMGRYALSLTTAALKTFTLKAATMALNMVTSFLVSQLVSAAISGIISLYSQLHQTMDDLHDSLEESVNKFDESANEAKELESELKACTDRIAELQKLADNETISIADKKELELLHETNDELERKIALKKEEKIDDAKDVLDDAKNLLNKKVLSSYTYVDGTEETGSHYYAKVLPTEEFQTAISKYESGDVKNHEIDPKSVIEKTYAMFSPAIDAYKKLIEYGYDLSEEQETEYNNLKRLQDEYLLYRYNINGTKETFKALNEEQKRKAVSDRLIEKGLEKDNIAAILGNISSDELDEFWDKDFSFVPPELTDYNTAEEYGKAYVTAWLNGVRKETEKNNTLSFKEAWNSIGTSGDEKADKKAKEAKEELLELAKAGKLTEDAFSKSTIAENFLKQTKLSAREATQEINELVSSADQLSSMKTGISSISTILGEKKENLSSKKTRTKGIGADTLAGMPEDIKKQKKEYEHFVEVLGDGMSSMDDCRDAANKLATAYVTSGNFLSNLTDENKNYYKSVLDEMGVKNAAKIVDETAIANKEVLAYKTQALQAATKDMAGETSNASQKFLEEEEMTSLARTELADLVAQQQVFSSTELNTADKINELNRLAEAYFGVSNAITLASGMGADPRYYTEETIKKQWEKLLKKKTKVAVGEVDVKANTSKSKSGNGKGSKSKSKQQFDWISRALDRLSSKLDLVKAKYDSLFTGKKIKDSDSLLKKQNKNLDKQYKLLQKTGKYQDSARKKYTEKANRVRISKNKKENASLKKAVREGRINSKSMKKLIATYGEKKAEKIQKYQNWYETCHFA